MLTEKPCPYCNGAARWLWSGGDRNRRTTAETFNHFRCIGCGLVFLSDVPDDLRKYYAEGYSEKPKDFGELRILADRDAYRLEPILRFKTMGRLLEIGPWMGVTAYAAKRVGFEITAIESDESCVRFLSEVLRIETMQSDDPAGTMFSMDREFDIIALWHAIEHLPRPWDVIKAASQRLAPGGILLLSAPNPDSAQFEILGEQWIHLDTPRHLNLLPISLIERLGNSIGLTLVYETTSDKLSQLIERDAWNHAINRRIPIPVIRGLARMIGVPLLRSMYRRILSEPRRGAGYTVILRKPA